MSVVRSKRKIAFSEFERQAITLLKYTHERMQHTPNRYKKYLCPQIYELANRVCSDAVFANEQYAKDPRQLAERIRLIEDALEALQALQRPLYCYWNVMAYKPNSMQYWADMANRELALLCGVLKDTERMKALDMIKPFPYEQLNKALFLKKIADLQRYTYGKIVHEPTYYKDYILDNITHLVDDALCSAIFGNRKIPENKHEYETRKRHFIHALQCLNALQRPLYALWNLHFYSENIMQEWADLIDDSIRLLQSVIDSDKSRFSGLP